MMAMIVGTTQLTGVSGPALTSSNTSVGSTNPFVNRVPSGVADGDGFSVVRDACGSSIISTLIRASSCLPPHRQSGMLRLPLNGPTNQVGNLCANATRVGWWEHFGALLPGKPAPHVRQVFVGL